ncbi:MAG: response regulator, partial [Anaerolineae bacterium]|nr:response regulator [Anaerolineae bacterium]
MASSPRIITVDPTGTIARIVRSATDLIGRSVILVDMTSGKEALEEVKSRPCHLLLTNVVLSDDIRGYQLAIQVRQTSPHTNVVILADANDPQLDPADMVDSPFIYLHRPVDIHQFLRVFVAGLDGGDVFAALTEAGNPDSGGAPNLGPVPYLDTEAARTIIDVLLTDVGAMAIVLASRAGEVLMERGAVGYIDREKLATTLVPAVISAHGMGDLVGGRTSTLHFYDGEEYDVFVLSVGLHHFLCLVFDGSAGNRQFGAVNRFGRRAAEDLIALLGAAAYRLEKAAPLVVPTPPAAKPTPVEETYEPIPRAGELAAPSEPEPLQLEPIADLDLSIFDQLGKMDAAAADDLFSPDKLAELAANDKQHKGGP